MQRKIAAFDFDGTLTYRDTLIPFLRLAAGLGGLARAVLISSPSLARYAFGLQSNDSAKEDLVGAALAGRTRAELQKLAAEWTPAIRLRPHMVERLRWHQEAGHTCVMVSASLDIYLESIAEQLGFDLLACTKLAWSPDDCFTGKFSTPNCWGPEKVNRLRSLVGPIDSVELHAYGDSSGDRDLIQSAQYAWFKGKPVKC